MYVLTGDQKLQGFLGGAASPNVQVTVVFHDVIQTTKQDFREYPRANQFSLLADTTETDVLDAAPQVGIFRHIDNITVFNADNAAATVTICIDDSGTNRILIKQSLETEESLVYTDGMGWQIV